MSNQPKTSVRLPVRVLGQLEKSAKERGVSVNYLIVEAVEASLARTGAAQ